MFLKSVSINIHVTEGSSEPVQPSMIFKVFAYMTYRRRPSSFIRMCVHAQIIKVCKVVEHYGYGNHNSRY